MLRRELLASMLFPSADLRERASPVQNLTAEALSQRVDPPVMALGDSSGRHGGRLWAEAAPQQEACSEMIWRIGRFKTRVNR